MDKLPVRYQRLRLRFVLVAAVWLGRLSPAPAAGAALHANHYVATTGHDNGAADGSLGNPWATITYALGHAPDGSTLLAQPGAYNDQVNLVGEFAVGVSLRSASGWSSARARSRTTSRTASAA